MLFLVLTERDVSPSRHNTALVTHLVQESAPCYLNVRPSACARRPHLHESDFRPSLCAKPSQTGPLQPMAAANAPITLHPYP